MWRLHEYNGDYWTGLMLGVDSLADLEAIAKRLLSDWMGVDAEKTIPVKFNGKAVGVWEVCVGMADGQDVIIRRPAAASVIKDDSKYRRPA